jgi:hypothetical protein
LGIFLLAPGEGQSELSNDHVGRKIKLGFWLQGGRESAMGAVLVLLTLSALIGFALGRFSWLAIATSSVALALLSAAGLQLQGFNIFTGIALIVICLTVSQTAYLMGVLFVDRRSERLFQKQASKFPG